MRLPGAHLVRLTLCALCAGCGLVADLGETRIYLADGGMPDGSTSDVVVDAPSDDAAGGDDSEVDSSGPVAGGLRALSLALGATHACAIILASLNSPEDGTVRCWGSNTDGELGSMGADTSTPRTVQAMPGIPFGNTSSLALGTNASCATTHGNVLFCWGLLSGLSLLGVNQQPAGGPNYQPAEMIVGGSSDSFTSASIGDGGCAVTALSGELLCWGRTYAPVTQIEGGVFGGMDEGGKEAGGEGFYSTYPTLGAASVGRAHACALMTDGTNDVACWGDNSLGQLGTPGISYSITPQPVGLATLAGSAVVEVASGGDHSCAVLANLSTYCWGANESGQLGNGAFTNSATPTLVRFPHDKARHVSLGDSHTCARMESLDSVQCWGDNSKGQLGRGPMLKSSATPLLVLKAPSTSLPYVESVAAGGNTTCAARNPSSAIPVSCWGDNTYGQAGQPAGVTHVWYATPMSL